MGFETVVLDKVANIIGSEKCAHFFCGTLFVECDENQARKVFHKLSKEQGVGRVQISQVGTEYAYDFV